MQHSDEVNIQFSGISVTLIGITKKSTDMAKKSKDGLRDIARAARRMRRENHAVTA